MHLNLFSDNFPFMFLNAVGKLYFAASMYLFLKGIQYFLKAVMYFLDCWSEMRWLMHIYFVFNHEIIESTVPQANLWICLRWCCEPSE